MFKTIYSKIGIKLLIVFSLALIVSMVSLIYGATRLIAEFGEFSASKSEANITDNTYAFLARITHEQAMRYDSTFQKIALASSLMAKQASHVYENRDSYSEEPLTPREELVISPKNGIFSNGPSEKTMVLYWGSSTISPAISRHIKAFSELDLFLENSKESNLESTACYVVSESAFARYYPNIHGVDDIPSGFDIRKAHWYVKARPENNPDRKTVWSSVYMDIVGQGLMTTASSPVYSEAGHYFGAAGIDVTLKSIVNEILTHIPSYHRMEGMFSFLVDSTGKIIAVPPEYLTMFDLKIETDTLVDSSLILEKSLLDSSNPEVRKIGKEMIEKPYLVSQFSLNGHPYIFSSHFMPSTGWRLGVAVPESVLFTSVQETRTALDSTVTAMTAKFTLIALSFLLGAIIIVLIFSLKTIINPLNILSKAALRVKGGDLTTQVEIQKGDEIGTLAHSFNDMVVALRKGRELEKGYTRKLEHKVDERTLELRGKNDELKNTLQTLKQEIAERKEVQEELKRSEARYQSVFDNTGTATVLIEADMTISFANTEFERLSGYSREEIEGKKKWKDFVCKEDFKRMEGYHTKRRSTEGEVPTEYEFLFVDRQDNVKNIFIKTRMIPGTKISVASLMDITARKQTDELLEAQRARLNSLFTYSGEAIVLLDLENYIMDTNPAFENVFGYSEEEARGKIIEDLICPERFYYTEAKELDKQSLQGIRGAEIIRQRKDGREINVRVSAGPIKIGGTITGRYVVFDDITEKKRAEEALQRERDKLKGALDKVKTLHGLIPICANCKKIRDDKGYWTQVETYIRDHSEADFSHSLCPECEKKLYPDYYKDDES